MPHQHRTVTLHGGPRHGELASIEDGRTEFIILKPEEDLKDLLTKPIQDFPRTIKIRTGTYSQVKDHPADFEWDGWKPHA